MAANLELAITAIRSDRKEEGRQLLNLLIQQNPNDEMAWLWMSSVVNSDEQRARCLYHVLAINPDSDIARRGLQLLGIVVSDSRPVRVPRDSQPIQIPKPTSTQSKPVAQSTSQAGQRSFRIDPKTITDELPFTPVRAPFKEATVRASPSVLAIDVSESVAEPDKDDPPQDNDISVADQPSAQPVQHSSQLGPADASPAVSVAPSSGPKVQSQHPSGPMPVKGSDETQEMPAEPPGQDEEPSKPMSVGPVAETQEVPQQSPEQSGSLQPPSEPVPVIQSSATQQMDSQSQIQSEQPQHSSEPLSVVHSNAGEAMVSQPQTASPPAQSGQQIGPGPEGNQAVSSGQMPPLSGQTPVPPDTGSLDPNTHSYPSPQSAPANQYQAPPNVGNDTRPSQPVPVSYPNMNAGMGPGNQLPYYRPAQVLPSHAAATMGLSAQYLQPQDPSQPMPLIHSNPTMGMPLPPPGGQFQRPSEPVSPIHSNATLGMNPYGQAQLPQSPYPGAFHSSSTILMPTMTEAEARARLATGQATPTSGASFGAPQIEEEVDENEGEEINIMAVIIFGSLSVTALGGLGMLILLMFTTTSAG